MDLAALDRRLTNVEFISSFDEPFHAELAQRIVDLGGQPIPSNHPHSWRRNFTKLTELERRQPKPVLKPDAGQSIYVTLQNTAKRLRDERNFLKNVLYRENYTEADLDLEPGDLTNNDLDNDSLTKISSRVSKIYDQLRPLSSDQTRIYFLEKRVLKLEAAIAAKS